MDSLRLHGIEAHHVFLAVLAYRRNSGCPACTERIDRFRFISSPPAEGLGIGLVGSVMDQESWTSCKKRNHVTRTQQQILRSVRMEQDQLFPYTSGQPGPQDNVRRTRGQSY